MDGERQVRMARHRAKDLKDLAIQAYIANGGHVSKSCATVQINRHTWTAWWHKDPEFKARIIEADEAIKDNMEITLKTQALERGNWAQLKYFLEMQCRERGYLPESQRVEHAGEIILKIEKTILGDSVAGN